MNECTNILSGCNSIYKIFKFIFFFIMGEFAVIYFKAIFYFWSSTNMHCAKHIGDPQRLVVVIVSNIELYNNLLLLIMSVFFSVLDCGPF